MGIMSVTDKLSVSTCWASAAWLIQASANIMEEKNLMETSWHSTKICTGLQRTKTTWQPKHEVLYSFTEKIMLSRVIRKWHLLSRINVSILSKGCNLKHDLIPLAALLLGFGSSSLSCLPQIPLQDAKFPAYPWIRFGCEKYH